jgi:hypothetical protein
MPQSKRFTLLAVLGAAFMMLAVMASTASAAEPAPGFERFAGCPSPEESPGTPVCVLSHITGGHLDMGSKEVPIKNPLTLSGAVNEEFEEFTASPVVGLYKTPQKVPGGVIGLTGLTWLLEFFGSEALTLYATTELTGPPTGFNFSSVTIPIKVHLTNPAGLLGNSCYIGSNSEQITLNLTTGTTSPPPPNEPISGQVPKISVDEQGVVHVDEGIFVDNSFAAPGANGCVLKLFGFIPISLNGFVDEQSGLPSPAGTNETVQDFNIEFAPQEEVYP